MKIVIAPDSFKGSLSSFAVAESIERGIKKVIPKAHIIKVPMADGGEGTLEAILGSVKGEIVSIKVKDPLFRETFAEYGLIDDGKTAIIEMSRASGLTLLSEEERNPLITSTYGTGQLIKDALDKGCNKLIICIGGSATNDGGAGMVMALGAKFFKQDGREMGFGGGALGELRKIGLSSLDKRIKECEIFAACDVTNPLCGKNGASFVYGPQKGASLDMLEELDKNLFNYGKILKDTLDIDVLKLAGAGAAGGMGAGLYAFLDAKLKSGVDLVVEATGLKEKIAGADLVITGEGMMDAQTVNGKTPFGVAKVSKELGAPVIGIVGSIGQGAEVLYNHGIDSIFSIVDGPITLKEAMMNCSDLLEGVSERIARVLSIKL